MSPLSYAHRLQASSSIRLNMPSQVLACALLPLSVYLSGSALLPQDVAGSLYSLCLSVSLSPWPRAGAFLTALLCSH